MQKIKRLVIATLSGILFGLVCCGLASSGPELLPLPIFLQIIFSRTLIGFAIGICAFKLGHWTLRGLVLGFIFSLPMAFSGLMAPGSPDYTQTGMFIGTVFLGAIYGLLIEIITSIIFKAKLEK